MGEGLEIMGEGEEYKLCLGFVTLWYRGLRETLCTFTPDMDTGWLESFCYWLFLFGFWRCVRG